MFADSRTGQVVLVDPRTGRATWSWRPDDPERRSVTAFARSGDLLVVGGARSGGAATGTAQPGWLVGLSARTGRQAWVATFRDPVRAVLAPEPGIVVALSEDPLVGCG